MSNTGVIAEIIADPFPGSIQMFTGEHGVLEWGPFTPEKGFSEPVFRPTCYHPNCCVVYRLKTGKLRCHRRPWWDCQTGDQPEARDFPI
jgi:hypothetical protein